MKKTVFNTWEEIKEEINSIFGEQTRDYKKEAMDCFNEIFEELETNYLVYLNNEEAFQDYLNSHQHILQGFYYWMPYLSGERALLLQLKMYDANFKLLDQTKMTEEEAANAYMVISVNTNTLQKFVNNRTLH